MDFKGIPLAARLVLAAAAGGSFFVSGAACASMALSYQETSAGTTGAGTVSALAVPGSYVYSDTFSAPSVGLIGPNPGYGFYDDFEFQISSASTDAITSTINLGNGGSDVLAISNLSVRLYSANGNTPPVLGLPNGGVIDGWSTPVSVAPGITGTVNVLPWTVLPTGTYVLEIRGTVTGSAGGSYSGTLNAAAVPLPASWSLMIGGLGLLGLFASRRNLA